jgi:cofilin
MTRVTSSIPSAKLAPDCLTAWNDLLHLRLRYVLLAFSDDLEWVVVESQGKRESTYNEFLEELPPMDVRYALCFWDYPSWDGTIKAKTVFVVWGPDIAPVMRKLLLAASKSTVRNAFGCVAEIWATDDSEITEAKMRDACRGL